MNKIYIVQHEKGTERDREHRLVIGVLHNHSLAAWFVARLNKECNNKGQDVFYSLLSEGDTLPGSVNTKG